MTSRTINYVLRVHFNSSSVTNDEFSSPFMEQWTLDARGVLLQYNKKHLKRAGTLVKDGAILLSIAVARQSQQQEIQQCHSWREEMFEVLSRMMKASSDWGFSIGHNIEVK